MNTNALDIWVHKGAQDVRAGQAYFTRQRGRISTTFAYDASYLAAGGTSIDPSLAPVPGAQHQAGMLCALADSAPDRWGRNLIAKAERLRAATEQRRPRALDELDYLLGVSDIARQGNLRLTWAGGTDFLGTDTNIPKLVSLPELLAASDEVVQGDETPLALKRLLDTGTTGLGGARPKASVLLEDGGLAIAKFPHAADQWDVMAWEAVTLDLLADCGVRIPEHRITQVGERSVHILRRFDRGQGSERYGYISLMTALGAHDGESYDYADIAAAVRELSSNVAADQEELFRRAVAYVALGNTDDHLRNHAFLHAGDGWRLAPAFDVNSVPDLAKARATSIMGADTYQDETTALGYLADECDLDARKARAIAGEVLDALSYWAEVATRHGIRSREITLMGPAITTRCAALATAQQHW